MELTKKFTNNTDRKSTIKNLTDEGFFFKSATSNSITFTDVPPKISKTQFLNYLAAKEGITLT